ncbi:MAG TPA: TetR/AcrR family transcriptional regulator [Streptosporangiaceae bacterium]|nr:TetR/AcrR family transcriptional regulator [Streptosporangiaceae bacterium]
MPEVDPDPPAVSPAAGEAAPRRRRGRPRSEKARQAILAAAGDLMLSGGLPAATMDAIAARAGVSKATVYKWWPSRGAVALDGFLDRVVGTLAVPDGLSAAEALTWQIDALIQIFRDTTAGPLMRALVAVAQSDPDIAGALREQWLAPRRAVALDTLRSGVQRGELRDGLDLEAVLDELFAPVYYRLFFGHAPLSDDLPATMVGHLMTGIAAPAQPSGGA